MKTSNIMIPIYIICKFVTDCKTLSSLFDMKTDFLELDKGLKITSFSNLLYSSSYSMFNVQYSMSQPETQGANFKFQFQCLNVSILIFNFNVSMFQGPETSFGASNFIPSWMYWQKLPRVSLLQMPLQMPPS